MDNTTCPNGHPNPGTNAFCGTCGAPLARLESQPAAPVPASPVPAAPPAPVPGGQGRNRKGLVAALLAAALVVGLGVWFGTRPHVAGTDVAMSATPTSGSALGVYTPPPPTAAAVPVKSGKFGVASCDIGSLFIGGGNNSLMVGSTQVHNTGTVPINVVITFAWLFADGSRLSTKDKTVTVGVGSSKTVLFHATANGTQVSLFQAMPAYLHASGQLKNGNLCKTTANIK